MEHSLRYVRRTLHLSQLRGREWNFDRDTHVEWSIRWARVERMVSWRRVPARTIRAGQPPLQLRGENCPASHLLRRPGAHIHGLRPQYDTVIHPRVPHMPIASALTLTGPRRVPR
jgi:hypothetical protein